MLKRLRIPQRGVHGGTRRVSHESGMPQASGPVGYMDKFEFELSIWFFVQLRLDEGRGHWKARGE